ncbi:MAG TPA: phage head closure protein [Planctomycetota bacterium]|nr:phage head closure protein [Planctomycetota bacterium]
MPLQAGKLNHRVAIQSSTSTQGATGEPTKAWATDATVWASVEPIAGREYFAAQQVAADVTHRVRMRYRSDVTITPLKRLLIGARIIEIVSALNIADGKAEWEILCRETV